MAVPSPLPVPLISPNHPRTTIYKVPERQPQWPVQALNDDEYDEQGTWEGRRTPIVVDLGSSATRAGFACNTDPLFSTESVISKYRDRKTSRPILLAGNDVYADATSRSNSKPICEEGVVCNFDCLEAMMDYVFLKLNVSGDYVDHPIIMTEPLANPLYNRALSSEILFESYRVPSLVYGVDSLFAFSDSGAPDGLILSSSHSSTSLIPVLGGRSRVESARRLNWGAEKAADYMLKLMQLKYPSFPSRMTPFQASALVREHCQFAVDYGEEIRELRDPQRTAQVNRIIQFPFTAVEVAEKTEEELAIAAEKKRLAGERLQEQTAKMRADKLAQNQRDLDMYTEIFAWKDKESKTKWSERCAREGVEEGEVESMIKKLQNRLRKARNRDLGIVEEEPKGEPDWSLLEVPDHQLDEDTLKEKRKQRLMKAGYDARERQKAERQAEKLRIAEEKRLDEEARLNDPVRWLEGLRMQHRDVIDRIKERKKRKTQLSDRKSLAAQLRMKTIATLASESGTGGGSKGKKRKKGNDDTFGADDADWAVYRDVAGADESADEEEEATELAAVESRLLEHDPAFTTEDTHARVTLRKHALLNAFLGGAAPGDPLPGSAGGDGAGGAPKLAEGEPGAAAANAAAETEDLERAAQLHVNIERIRVPEPLYQPLMAGVDQAGLLEVAQYVMREFTADEQRRLTSNIFVTGGHSLLPNFDLRLSASFRSILPVSYPLGISRCRGDRPLEAAWRGMARWANTEACRKALVTRAEYDEYGGEWIKEHAWGNRWRGR